MLLIGGKCRINCIYVAGKCFCLYPEDGQLPSENLPQILEANITPTVLFLKRMEIAGIRQCDFMDRPGLRVEISLFTVPTKEGGWLGGGGGKGGGLRGEGARMNFSPV